MIARITLLVLLTAPAVHAGTLKLVGVPDTYVPGDEWSFDVRLSDVESLASYNIEIEIESDDNLGPAAVFQPTSPPTAGYVFPSNEFFATSARVVSGKRHALTISDFLVGEVDTIDGLNDLVATVTIDTQAELNAAISLSFEIDGLLLDDVDGMPIPEFAEVVKSALQPIIIQSQLERPGDYNGNGLVEQGDLDLVLLNWGGSGEPPPANWTTMLPRGRIDQDELDGVLLHWGDGFTPAKPSAAGTAGMAGTQVPEPACYTLLLCCVMLSRMVVYSARSYVTCMAL
jgi:hypothetical protein